MVFEWTFIATFSSYYILEVVMLWTTQGEPSSLHQALGKFQISDFIQPMWVNCQIWLEILLWFI